MIGLLPVFLSILLLIVHAWGKESPLPCVSDDAIYHPIVATDFSYTRGYRSGIFSHKGIDISVQEGTKIRALRSGILQTVKWDRNRVGRRKDGGVGYGYYLIIAYDDGNHGYYAHLQPGSVSLSPGTRVRGGEVIALSGNSGSSTGPHLHYGEWNPKLSSKNDNRRKKKGWVDPAPLIVQGHLKDYPELEMPSVIEQAWKRHQAACRIEARKVSEQQKSKPSG